jgi:hypothetical protein
MKLRNILIALVVIAAGISGGVTMFSQPSKTSGNKVVVINRSAGVAYAQAGGGGATPPPAGGDAAAGDAAAPAADAAPKVQLSDDEWLKKLEDWKNSDPRDILKAKYKDLQAKETHPENEDNPEQFIPETGRVDPMTIVDGAIPDELKPPRGGETDENEAENYLYTAAASEIVDYVGISLKVYNVLQIGLDKIVTVRVGNRRYNLHEGQSLGITLASEQGIPVDAGLVLSAASVDEVTITVTGQPWGSLVSVSKNFTYIPNN